MATGDQVTHQCLCEGVFEDDFPKDNFNSKLWSAAGFSAKLGQVLLTPGAEVPVLLTGLGLRKNASTASVRLAGAVAARYLIHLDAALCNLGEIVIPGVDQESIRQAAAEGIHLGAYVFDSHKTHRRAMTKWDTSEGGASWDLGVEIAGAVLLARDLVNEPANFLTPSSFATRCKDIAVTRDLGVSVLEESDLLEGNFGGILAVGKGSVERPLLVRIDHLGSGGKIDLCLVGKGVTFDSGGLSLKEPNAMIGMKQDMAGAAAVLAAMSLLKRIAPNLHVVALLPMVENMPGPYSTRPGDVVTMRSGKTVEILNSDFEGRLILGDALALAAEHAPAVIVDVATLTAAAINALGERTAALFGNNCELITLLENAATRSGERAWHLPFPDHLDFQIESLVADIKNFPGSANARSATAAMFLQKFVPEDLPWAHLDIAGPAWANEEYELTTVGGTGFGVRLLVELFQSMSGHIDAMNTD
jgi:leucyl aminopeptidase